MSEVRADYGLAQSDNALKSEAVISPLEIVKLVLPVYLLLVAGAVLRRTGLIRKEHDAGIMRVVFSVMFPCFILDKILGSSGLHSSFGVLWAIGLGGGMILVGILLGFGVARLIGLENGTGMRTFALSAGCQNYGYTAVPVVEIIWGSSALGLLFVHNVGVEIAIWSVGVMLLSGGHWIAAGDAERGPSGDWTRAGGDVADRCGCFPPCDPPHRVLDGGHAGRRKTLLENHRRRCGGATRARSDRDFMRGEIFTSAGGDTPSVSGASGDASGNDIDHVSKDLWWPPWGGGSGRARDHRVKFADLAVDHHVGQSMDRVTSVDSLNNPNEFAHEK